MAVVQYPPIDQPTHPTVSVCIANFNGEKLLIDCIDSVLLQATNEAIEIIVHDDASEDSSVALLRQCYPGVRLLASQENVGFCTANNRMVSAARGDYVLLLNNDAALHIDAIETLLAAARGPDAMAILTLPQYDWATGVLVDRGCMLDAFCNPVPNLSRVQRDVAYVIGACLWIQRAAWRELGGFPEWMESLAEDLYLCGVARLRGIPVRSLTESGYRHRQGASFSGSRGGTGRLRTSFKRRRLSEHNKTRALFILTPGPAMWPLFVAHLVALAVEGLVLCVARREMSLWREIYRPVIAMPWREAYMLRARRREVQALRAITVGQWFSVVRWQLRKVVLLMRFGLPEIL